MARPVDSVWDVPRNDVAAAVAYFRAAKKRGEPINDVTHTLYRLQDDPQALIEALARIDR